MSYSMGIPLQSAIIVRHTPRDYSLALGRRGTGAIAVGGSGAKGGLDYIGREGRHSGKSDIEREPTAYDMKLARGQDFLPDRLDYIGRQGDFAGKGADRQVDATYWSQHGAVSRAGIEADMVGAGGAYVDSILCVKREYAGALGLESKEDFQRLMRRTWADSAFEWGCFSNREDIRWVACFHTDASESLHVHVYTYSARGEIEPGFTVGREATRRAKAVIFREGYAYVREHRNALSDLVRQAARLEALVQLGREVPRRDVALCNAKAARLGHPELSVSDKSSLGVDARLRMAGIESRLETELGHGFGRLSGNYRAIAAARELLHALEEASPPMARYALALQGLSRTKADIAGYSQARDGESWSKERLEMLRGDREDYLRRVASGLLRSYAPARPARGGDRVPWRDMDEAGRKACAQRSRDCRRGASTRRPGGTSRAGQDRLVRSYGYSLDDLGRMARAASKVAAEMRSTGARSYEGLTDSGREQARLAAALTIDGSPRFRKAIAEEVLAGRPSGGPDAGKSYARIRGAYVDRFARVIAERSGRGNLLGQDGRPFGAMDGFSLACTLLEAAASMVGQGAAGARGGFRGKSAPRQDRDARYWREPS